MLRSISASNSSTPTTSSYPLRTVVLLTIAGVLTACGKAPDQGAQQGLPTAPVTFDVVKPRDIAVEREYVGQANGSREVEVRARVNGIVERRLYEEGAVVKKDQPLFKLDSGPYAASVANAEAAVATAEANLKQAEREYARLKPLIESKAISQKEWDTAASTADISRAQLKQAQAQLAAARIDLGYTDIRAPITGVVGRALKMEGSLAAAASDSLLTTMAQTDPMYVNFSIAEGDRTSTQAEVAAGALTIPKSGYVVQLKTSDGRVLKTTGKMDFNDYKADANTGAYAARAVVANADGAITPGQFLRVILSGGVRPNAIALPQRAVLDGPAGKFVYLVGQGKDGKPAAQPRPVVPGEWVTITEQGGAKPENGWIIRQGLKAGDQVVIDGMARIFAPGQPLQPMTKEEAAKAAAAAPQGPGGPGAPGGGKPAEGSDKGVGNKPADSSKK
jgi:membrane fusion protein, multidrug efflux system